MNPAVEHLLESFDALSQSDQQQAAVEILRCVVPTPDGDLQESTLIEAAEALFVALDKEEADHAQR